MIVVKLSGYITARSAAKRIGVTKAAVHQMVQRGKLQTERLFDGEGKLIRSLLLTESVDRLIEARAAYRARRSRS